MGSLNKGHHETSGGVVIFNGELILLFCDAVNCEVSGKGSAKGRLYLTTHRLIFTATPINQNANLKSFSAPFFAMFDLDLEQPVFGANKIKGKVRSEETSGPPFSFKLSFNKGGAIELGQAMAHAAKAASAVAQQMNYQQPPPAYTPAAAETYYQAANSVYQPAYPVGFVLPTQVFNQAPPAGFVYATDAPPPYPGLTTLASQQQAASAPYAAAAANGFGGYGAPQPPAYGQPSFGPPPNIGFMNGAAAAGGAAGGQNLPSYDQATKKSQ